MRGSKYAIIALKKCAFVAVIVVMSVMMVSCKKDKPATENGENVTVAVSNKKVQEASTANIRANMARSRLTGEWVDKDTVNNVPVAVMIENSSDAIPQSAIGSADIVFETYAEGGITRLCAVFENKIGLDKIGPVRSCRLYYLQFAKEFEANYVHFGYADSAEASLKKAENHALDGMVYCDFYRTSDRIAPHNAYTSWKGIMDSVVTKGYPTEYADDYKQPFTFTNDDKKKAELKDATTCNKMYPGFTNNKPWFEYEASTGEYLRYQFDVPQIDAETKAQLSYKNILIKYTPVEGTFGPTPNFIVNGEGKGIYITEGKAAAVTWKKDKADSGATKYYYSDGTEVVLNPGKTWICQVELNQDVQIVE